MSTTLDDLSRRSGAVPLRRRAGEAEASEPDVDVSAHLQALPDEDVARSHASAANDADDGHGPAGDPHDAFFHDVVAGLAATRRTIPCLWLYDRRGSELFEEITTLEEYYPTRTEARLLAALAPEVARVVGDGASLVELGSGSSIKTRLLLRAMPTLARYLPVDISADFLHDAVASLRQEFPGLPIEPVVADFSRPFQVPRLGPPELDEGSPVARFEAAEATGRYASHALGAAAARSGDAASATAPRAADRGRVPDGVDASASPPATSDASPRLGFFPGSTIGNFMPEAAVELLGNFARALGPGSWLLIGVDTTRDAARLVRAYDDARGVTAAFDMNLLTRINRELGADFDLDAFHHEARFDESLGRVEMHLVSDRDQVVTLRGHRFPFTVGESIHTENAYKYDDATFRSLAARAGWRCERAWRDDQGSGYTVYLARAVPATA